LATISIMVRKTIVLIFAAFIGFSAYGQSKSADSVYNKYLDFNLARFQGEHDKVMELGEEILPNADKLPEKARINFYFAVGKMYEDNDQHQKALPYYEKVAAAVPDYYVVHRALGYLYLDNVKEIAGKLNAATKDITLNRQLTIAYNDAVKKALPHLEKAQACDPSDETLAIIKSLYKNIKDEQGLNSLNNRLKELSKNCMDILSDR
jgi:tetratricopeptide (TPR) repeat protein